jgi:hypothetical protein
MYLAIPNLVVTNAGSCLSSVRQGLRRPSVAKAICPQDIRLAKSECMRFVHSCSHLIS